MSSSNRDMVEPASGERKQAAWGNLSSRIGGGSRKRSMPFAGIATLAL